MEALERHRGHFYNWYDTLSLKPLQPLYISTVDSGNLAADLLTLRPGLLALPDQKILATRLFEGLSRHTEDSRGRCRRTAASAQLAQLQKDLASACGSRPTTLTAARLCLDRLATSAEEVVGSLDGDPESEAKRWARAFVRQCQGALDELAFLAPWILLPPANQSGHGDFPAIDEIPTLRELAELGGEATAGNRESVSAGA